MDNNNTRPKSSIINSDNFDLELTLKPIIRILLRFLKVIYIIGFLVIGIELITVLLLFGNIYMNFLPSDNKIIDFINNNMRDLTTGPTFLFWCMSSICTYKFYKPLKRYYHSGLKSDLVESFYQLQLIFLFLIFYVILLIGFVIFR